MPLVKGGTGEAGSFAALDEWQFVPAILLAIR
jgi:hypothetical protein